MSVLHRLLISLLVATVVALAWNAFGMESTLVVDAHSPFKLSAVDDRTSGGDSVAAVARDGDGFGLDCQVPTARASAFCELRVEFGKAPFGIDLSRYDDLHLWISATGPEGRQRVRVAVRNFDPAYANPAITESQKVDQVVYEPALYPSGHQVPLAQLAVAPGWIAERPPAAGLDAPDFRNVTMLAVATGPMPAPGLHRIRIDRIEFSGKLIPTAAFRLGVVAVWMLAALGYLVGDAVVARRQLRLSSASQHSLQRLNESLMLETRNLAQLARLDPLTGVLNRKGLADELTRMVRMGGDAIFPLTLVFIDIDHIKRVNDEHGRAVGDQVIKGLAALVRSAVQRDDLFARWGGEEFLLVFRNTPGLEARTIAERLRERIAQARWPDGLHVTCSFGVAEWHQGEALDDGVQRADEAMYRAKRNGRDRVEIELELDGPVDGALESLAPEI